MLPFDPQVLPTLPNVSGGPMSPIEIYNTISNLYNSPLAQYLPPMTEMLSTAIKVNSMSRTVQEASDNINKIMKDAVNKLASDLGVKLPPSTSNPITALENLINMLVPTTTKASILGSISNWLSGSTTAKYAAANNNPLANLFPNSG